MNYRYAQAHTSGPRWYVEYYCTNPATDKLTRKRVYINRLRSNSLKERTARKLCDHINARLDSGWNPFVTITHQKLNVPLKDAFTYMMKFKAAYLRPRSLPNYRERISSLLSWIENTYKREILSHEFTESMAQDFMHHQITFTGINARTFNSKLIDYRGFFNFLQQHRYCQINPFKVVKNLKEQDKKRMPLSSDMQRRYRDHVKENDLPLYYASMLCYYCGLRPVEIVGIRIRDIRGENKLIHIYPENGKGGRQRSAPVPDVFYPELQEYITAIPEDFYLFSTNLLPGVKKIAPTRLAGRFAKVRDALGIPPEITFYSLKDTSAENLDYAGFSTKSLQLLYGHSTIATTDKYMTNFGAKAFKQLIENFPRFGV